MRSLRPSPWQDPTDLRSMVEPVEPDPVAMGPDTPAAWLLLALLVAAALATAWWLLRRWQADAYRRAALLELERLEACLADPPSPGFAALTEVNAILKRAALAAWPRDAVAALSGERWLRFLETTGSPQTEASAWAPLADAAYRSAATQSADPATARRVLAAARSWIRSHRPGETRC